MKNLLFLLLFFVFNFTFGKSQVFDQQQILEMQKAYMNSGDTIGIYATVNGKYQQLEPVNYSGMKANASGYAFTGGLAKAKTKTQYKGITSPYPFKGKAFFRMYFGMVPTNKAARYYMFSNNYTVRDFSIVKFSVKKNKRQLTSATYGLFSGYSSGVSEDEDVLVTTTEVRDGVYDIEVDAEPGEYGFLFSYNGVGVYQAIFDFTITE